MRKIQRIAALVILVLIGVTVYGIWRTQETEKPIELAVKNQKKPAAAPQKSLVDQSPLKTAQQLAQLATTHDEKSLAQEALRLADFEVDLTFDTALHDARLHPPPLSPEAKEVEQRLQKAERLLKADQDRAKQLSEQIARLPEAKRETLELDLVQAEADLDLDQDEVDDAKQDFIAAGGDITEKIQAMRKEHEDAAHGSASAIPTGTEPPEQLGLLHRAQQWSKLHQKQMQLWQAKSQAESLAAAIAAKHNELDGKIDAAKESLPELAHHSKKSKADAVVNRVSAADKSREESSALLQKTQDIAEDQKTLAALDKRRETETELAGVYTQWIDLVRTEQYRVLNRALFGMLIILVIGMIGLYFGSWMDTLIGQLTMDRRQVQSLRTVTRVSLQFVALLLMLLVILGPPGQLGTFLGLAGAGLTVALKDFIVGFIGWFVLMGKNGLRLGDWVEINGVSGEVQEIGPFHTVLLETGNWTDSGHPTGRRVTFMNSFAVEGHFFNFSTTGQWLWDELQVVLPTGQDPYPVIDEIRKKVTEATTPYAEKAEQEWRSASTSREMSEFSAAPAISVKSVVGGIEVSVRYITRANERYGLRSKLNQDVVELLGGRPATVGSKA
ncbi:MAG: mechanosensitive ion channel domain-containing protein [Candidatus Acidiferrum sp.]